MIIKLSPDLTSLRTFDVNSKLDNGTLDIHQIRNDFPILAREVNGKPLVYLDNAASSQKPNRVIDQIKRYYSEYNSNIHRGVHSLGEQATIAYEEARNCVKNFINAADSSEIIFVRGVTEAINLVANCYGLEHIKAGDEIVISTMEHHSNIVPWQFLCEKTGAILRVIKVSDEGEIDLTDFEHILSERTRFVSLVHISNSLGTINPIKWIIDKAHEFNVPVLIDGAQSAPHLTIDVQSLDCDFYTFSGHKIFAPTGVGVLYGKREILESLPPYQGGGEMIQSVTFEKTTYNTLPHKFEAGTPNIAGVIGLGTALDYVNSIGLELIGEYERRLLEYATELMSNLDGVKIIGTAKNKAGVISFVCDEVHPHDIATLFDLEGIAIRAGHHCTQPLMDRLGLVATARLSFAFYNTIEEIDLIGEVIPKVIKVFS